MITQFVTYNLIVIQLIRRSLAAQPYVYGWQIMQATGIPSGTMYPLLQRLENQGWIEGHIEQLSDADRGRPARRYYTWGKTGDQMYGQLAEQLKPFGITLS